MQRGGSYHAKYPHGSGIDFLPNLGHPKKRLPGFLCVQEVFSDACMPHSHKWISTPETNEADPDESIFAFGDSSKRQHEIWNKGSAASPKQMEEVQNEIKKERMKETKANGEQMKVTTNVYKELQKFHSPCGKFCEATIELRTEGVRVYLWGIHR